MRHKPGQITLLIEEGGKSVDIPDIIVDEDKLFTLIEKGCSLERIAELLNKEHPEKITPEIVLKNIKYNWPLTDALNQIFENARIMFLPLVDYFEEGVKTPEELNQKFISPENPDGIPVDELIPIAKETFPHSSFIPEVRKWVEIIKSW